MKCETCGGTGEKINPEDLRMQRELAGMDQKTCATRMKISNSYLCDLEQGRRDWDAGLLKLFANALRKTNHKRK